VRGERENQGRAGGGSAIRDGGVTRVLVGHPGNLLGCADMRPAAAIALALPLLCGCPSVAPPPSQLPDATAAIDRMRATTANCLGVQASAKIDHFGKQGRVRGELELIAVVPAKMRMDVISPFGVALATLTSDAKDFALADLRDKRFYVGPASACNIARLTTVPIPGSVLVNLLRGEAPVLRHEGRTPAITWSPRGYYVVSIAGTRDATEEVHLTPRPEDWGKAWNAQRMRVLDVEVKQQGIVLYHAELKGHAAAPMSRERVDPDGIDPPIPPSGPFCDAEIPRSIHVEVPGLDEDVLFRYDQVTWNPPLPEGVFTQEPRPGLQTFPVTCTE